MVAITKEAMGNGGHWAETIAMHQNPKSPLHNADTVLRLLRPDFCRWQPKCPGARFWREVLVPLHTAKPEGFTVADVRAKTEATLPKKSMDALRGGVAGDLAFLYTWDGGVYMTANGQNYMEFLATPKAATPATPKVEPAPKAKGKGKGKVTA
jgi:hypothetical protein